MNVIVRRLCSDVGVAGGCGTMNVVLPGQNQGIVATVVGLSTTTNEVQVRPRPIQSEFEGSSEGSSWTSLR